MNLETLFCGIPWELTAGTPDKDVKSIVYHSDKAASGSVFFAIKGADGDGRQYISAAVEKGATVIVTDDFELDEFRNCRGNAALVRTEDVRQALAVASANFFLRPSEGLFTVAVTGTKGKTTTSFMIKEIFEKAGIKTGIIGTVLNGCQGFFSEASQTTPQSCDIHHMLRQMVDRGCKAVVMEVSSQGLMQQRVHGIDFDVAVFTNISPDHISKTEHKSFEEYLYWKTMLFKQAKVAIINRDDKHSKDFLKAAEGRAEKILTFGAKPQNTEHEDYLIHDICLKYEESLPSAQFFLKEHKILTYMPGKFSVYNSAAAAVTGLAAGINTKYIYQALKEVKVRGRMEIVPTSADFTVMIDYAHNGTALENILKELREYRPRRLILVFGCGGGRDKSRRKQMGRAAARFADFSIITSDNPREENPLDIIEDITKEMAPAAGTFSVIQDRGTAILAALDMALPGDMVIIAGKGHETYQITGKEKRHFDDREVVSRWDASFRGRNNA